MTINEFIEKAIEGGWDGLGKNKREIKRLLKTLEGLDITMDYGDYESGPVYQDMRYMFLDPIVWQAVGKVEGWADNEENPLGSDYAHYMHGMVNNLVLGKTIESYLETL